MAQVPPRFCPQCGTAVPAGQRFCSNCGVTMDADFGKPTSASSLDPRHSQYPDMQTQLAADSIPMQGGAAPPPPPAQSFTPPSAAQPPYGNYATEPAQSSYVQANSAYGQQQAPAVQPIPTYAKPQKDSSKGVLGQIGCGVLVVILLVLAVCGVSGFFAYRWVSGLASSTSVSSTNTGNSTPANSITPTIVPVSLKMSAAVTYSSVAITLGNVQEASSFTDDANANSPVLLRVNMTEHNPTASTIFLFYSDNFRLLLPDGTSVVPVSEQNSGSVDQSVNRQNWIDFPLASKMDISTLTLQIGAPTEAQMKIPLTANVDVSKYQDKTISPNSSFQYAGLSWTLTTVMSSLSAGGKQATTGNRYITVTLKADNPTTSDFFLFADTNTRLSAGSLVSPPTSNTFNDIAPGTTGTIGTITFLVPQNSSSFTLTMLAQPNTTPPATQVTQTFQI
jgi:zinc-ribbon domain